MWRSIAMLCILCLLCRYVLLSVGVVAVSGVVSTASRRMDVRACAATRAALAVRAAFLGGGGDRSHDHGPRWRAAGAYERLMSVAVVECSAVRSRPAWRASAEKHKTLPQPSCQPTAHDSFFPPPARAKCAPRAAT